MPRKRKFTFVYFLLAAALIFAAGGYFYTEEITEYEKAVHKIEYQMGYIDVYATADDDTKETSAAKNEEQKRVVYLTFDDGSSPRTTEILDLLKEYNIKATFFIVSSDKPANTELLKRIQSEGHSIGVHSASHDYKKIYKSVDAFLQDFESCLNYIKDTTGDSPRIFRFPGGSVNSYNKEICKDLVEEMTRRGYTYFDWNVSSGDAAKGYTEESIYKNVMDGCKSHDVSVVLMHDSQPKKATVAALKRIIPDLLELGYTFAPLDETAQPTIFKIE